MKTQDFKGFIYSDNTYEIFDFDKEHKEIVPDLDLKISSGGIRVISCSGYFGAQVKYFTFSVFERIYDFLNKNGLSNVKIAVDNENLEDHKYYEFSSAKDMMKFAFSL